MVTKKQKARMQELHSSAFNEEKKIEFYTETIKILGQECVLHLSKEKYPKIINFLFVDVNYTTFEIEDLDRFIKICNALKVMVQKQNKIRHEHKLEVEKDRRNYLDKLVLESL